MTATSRSSGPITREDIESKFRELKGDIDTTAAGARDMAMTVAAVAGAIVVIGAFWFGSRRGRKKTTIVEVRRF